MKKIITLLLVSVSFNLFSQKIKTYNVLYQTVISNTDTVSNKMDMYIFKADSTYYMSKNKDFSSKHKIKMSEIFWKDRNKKMYFTYKNLIIIYEYN